jgi:hypothetical protein
MNRYVALVAVAAFLSAPVRAETRSPTEYQVKAAFIYNFAKYIQWPRPSGSDSNRPFVIGLIGKDPFGPVLDQVMNGQSMQERPVIVKRFERADDVVNCDVLFVSSSERKSLQKILDVLRRNPVLTVSDMDQFAERGGMIALTTENNRIRFELNVEAIDRAGLKAGSQLLRLARIVYGSRTGA